MMAHFIRNKRPLLNNKGQLNEPGYSTSLILDYDRRLIKAHALRIKEWDYYLITNGRIGLALTIADNSYMGLCSISLLHFTEQWEITKSHTRLFTMGRTNLPPSSEYGDICVHQPRYLLQFENHGNDRLLSFRMKNFRHEEEISGSITLRCPKSDSIVTATPFPKKPKHFYYNQKIQNMPASGHITLGNDTFCFEESDSMAVLDWGRGVWPYRNTWYWGSASGFLEGKPFGMNLGYGFGDTAAATENMLFYQRKGYKLDQVTFRIPKAENGQEDYLKPWAVADQDGRLSLQFVPVLDRYAKAGFKLLSSIQHQVFGHYSGYALLDDGTRLEINHLFGFAEKVQNRW